MLEEKINKDYVLAMKARDSFKSTALNMLRAQFKNIRIDMKKEQLEDVDVIAVIKKQVKQRQDSIEQFKSGGRDDLVSKESDELSLLKSYLPEDIPEAELKDIISNAIKDAGANSMKDMGKVMKFVAEKTAGRADNRLISNIVKKSLS